MCVSSGLWRYYRTGGTGWCTASPNPLPQGRPPAGFPVVSGERAPPSRAARSPPLVTERQRSVHILHGARILYRVIIRGCEGSLYLVLLNDREFRVILLIRDWPRRAFLDRTSEWVHRKCLTTVYSGCLWCHNKYAGFRVKFLLRLASLMCIFLWRHNIRTSFRADFCLRLTTPWTFLCD